MINGSNTIYHKNCSQDSKRILARGKKQNKEWKNPADTKVERHGNTKQHITLIYNRLNFVLNE